jgi:hypothetical protein
VFLLAVAAVCALAGAKSFREAGDQAADLPQEVLAALGGKPHPLRRRITAPSEKRIRTVPQVLDAAALDLLIGGWLAALASAGRLEDTLTAIAIDGKWLRGVAGWQVKLFAAMLHEEKAMIGQVRVPDKTTETTQVKQLMHDPARSRTNRHSYQGAESCAHLGNELARSLKWIPISVAGSASRPIAELTSAPQSPPCATQRS